MADRSIKTRDVVPFVLVFGLYLFTLSNNFSLTHDSVSFLLTLKDGHPEVHPNHLLYIPFLNLVVHSAAFVGGDLPVHVLVEGVGAAVGVLTLFGGYLILTRRFDVLHGNALAAMAATGMTYGVWYYSVAIEIYIFPLCLLTWTFFILTEAELNWRSIGIAAALHSLAMLLHQTAVLFSGVPLIILLVRRPESRVLFERLKPLLLYVGIGTAIVGTAYWWAAHLQGQAGSVREFVVWFLGYGSDQHVWSPMSPKAFFLAATGFGRSLIGGHFLFGIPALRDMLEAAYPANSLEDEAFLVQGLAVWMCYTLAVSAVAVCMFLLFLTSRAALLLVRKESVMPRSGLVLLLAWLIPYTLFSIAYGATNPDFWVVQCFLVMLLVTGSLQSRHAPNFQPAKFNLILAMALLFVNGAGTVIPASKPEYDYYRAKLSPLQNYLTEDDFLLIGDAWPMRSHLRLYSKVKFEAVSDVFRSRSVDAMSEMLSFHLRSGGRVFLAPDVFDVASASTLYYEPGYTKYLESLRARFCGTGDFSTGTGIELKTLTCLH